MSEKIDLQQEALNALKDAGLGSNSLRQAFIKGYRAHAYRQPSQEESDEDNLTSKCSCIYSDIQTALHDAYDRFETEDDRRLVELTNLVGRNCHELEGCLVIFTWKGEPKAGTLQFNGMSDLSVRDLDYDTDYVLEVWPDGSIHGVNKNVYDLHVFAGKKSSN